jgi:hypothetical protein
VDEVEKLMLEARVMELRHDMDVLRRRMIRYKNMLGRVKMLLEINEVTLN